MWPGRDVLFSPVSTGDIEIGGALPPLHIRIQGVMFNWLFSGATLFCLNNQYSRKISVG
jgi:hypothetical protein